MQKGFSSESDSSWSDWKALEWRKVLSLLTLQWAEPFLKFTGLPETLLQHLEEWKTIYAALSKKIGSFTTVDYPQHDDYAKAARKAISQSFRTLANQLGEDAPIELEKWVQLHFFCQEAKIAIQQWRLVLTYALPSSSPKRVQRQVPAPHALLGIMPEISDLIKFEPINSTINEMMLVAPPPPDNQSPYEKLSECYEATLLAIAISQGMVFQALQTVGDRLNESERIEVVVWAEQQLEVLNQHNKFAHVGDLCGTKYIQGINPCSSNFATQGVL